VDWAALMAAGMGGLRLSPDAFWAMTPRELRAALGLGAPPGGALGRAGLEALMAAHPDDGEGRR
jgi:uncharacterized phage protein (TIGR02216 family)